LGPENQERWETAIELACTGNLKHKRRLSGLL
jgi:hypothetical protein